MIAPDFGSSSRRANGSILFICDFWCNAEGGPKDKQDCGFICFRGPYYRAKQLINHGLLCKIDERSDIHHSTFANRPSSFTAVFEVYCMQHRDPVASVLLGEIHGLVGPLNKGGQLFLLLVFSHSDADGDLSILSVFR